MSNQLNFTRNISLEKEELNQLQSFLTNNAQRSLFEAITLAWGIIPQADLSGNDFLVENGTTAGTVKVANDSVAIDSDSLLLSLNAFDNYTIPNDSAYYWLKISHRYLNTEPGTLSINTSGEVSGTGTAFTDLLRNQTSGSPIKIKFYQESVEQVATTVNNNGVYEIVEIINDGSMILSGNFVAESNLNYIIIGSVALGTTLTSEQEEGIYSYNNCALELVAETVVDTAPTTGFTEGKDFYIARIRNVGGSLTITDKRSAYYWTLDLGVTLPSKAEKDASNITSTEANLWLEKLMLYQNDYLAITATLSSSPVDIPDTAGLIYVTGNEGGSEFDFKIKLPTILNKNKGKLIIVRYALLNTFGDDDSQFTILDANDNVLYNVEWLEDSSKQGLVILKNNGSSWGVISQNIYEVATTTEANDASNNNTVLTPSVLRNAFVNGNIYDATTTIKGVVEKATTAELQSGTANKYIDAEQMYTANGGLFTKVLEIGAWNMDSDTVVNVAHGLDFTKIRNVSVIVRNDTGSTYFNLIVNQSPGSSEFFMSWNTTNIIVARQTGGFFDSSIFDEITEGGGVLNRGYITIQYSPE